MIKHEISKVQKNSIAAEMDISCGDFLLSINGEEVRDILDYRFRTHEESLLVEIEKPDGEIWELDIEKDSDEDLGIEFKQSLMSHTKRCGNKCVFCFVDQQPPGLRPSLYVKDDDPRLSFLLGNYVTLTNLDEAEIKRLAGYHLSPLRVSVHATNLDVRAKMMGTDKARNLFDAIEVFRRAGIQMHFQIVLCKGLNDGAELDNTIKKLAELGPCAQSLAIVPAGLTRHREGLFPLEAFTRQDARDVIAQVERWQGMSLRAERSNPGKVQSLDCFGKTTLAMTGERARNGGRMSVFLSDEWYILAGAPLPKYKHYGEFPQLDNGVGVLRLFEREFMLEMNKAPKHLVGADGNPPEIAIATGQAAAGFMRSMAVKFMSKYPHKQITVHAIRNDFFGSSVTVSGLITGQDVISQLSGKLTNTDILLLPENAFRAGASEKQMLDGTTIKALEQGLNVKIMVGSTDGAAFYKQLANICN